MTDTTDIDEARPIAPDGSLAILVFVRDPKTEPKQFGWGSCRSSEFHRRLFRRTLECARGVAPVVVATDSPAAFELPEGVRTVPQLGARFGARLRSAVRGTFSLGFRRVLVIGTDTPSLTWEDLQRASQGIHAVGPARDGGCYLFTLEAQDLDAVADLPWCTPRLGSALVAVLRKNHGDVLLLETRDDLDDATAVERAKELLRVCRLWPGADALTVGPERGHETPALPARSTFFAPSPDRAPPVSLAA